MSVTTDRQPRRQGGRPRRDVRVTRWVATIAGLIGFVLSVATPLLPVVQTTAMLNWPQNGQLNSVTAPLISLTPVDVTATVPCAVVRDLPPEGGVVLGTAPKKGKDAALNALFVVVNGKRVDVTDRNVVIASVPRDQADVRRSVSASRSPRRSAGTFATFVGLTDPAGKPMRGGFADPNLRPQIVGVFTDLTGPAPPGLEALGDHRHPVLHHPNDFEAGRDGAGDRVHHRRAGRAVAPRPAGRPPDAPARFRRTGARSPWPMSR